MEVAMIIVVRVLFTVALLGFVRMVIKVCDAVILKPKRLRSILEKQGIRGPPPSFLLGNVPDMKNIQNSPPLSEESRHGSEKEIIHNCASVTFPYLHRWSEEYGSTFMFSIMNMQFLYMNDPIVLKEFSTYTYSNIGKSPYVMELFGPLAGQGIANSNGELWSRQRKIIAPEFFMDKVKGMTKLMVESVETTVVKPLISLIDREGGVADVNVDEYMTNFARDVISRLCFGSNHSEGEGIFLKLDALEEITSKQGPANSTFPLLRYIPTKSNREIKRLVKEIRGLILEIVNERKKGSTTTQKDLLQLISEAAANSDLSKNAMDTFIVDNCKSIYLGGYETTAASAMWTLMLLATNPLWQAKARAEVLDICGGQLPDTNMLRKMKIVTMVIQESLRLYPPAPVLSREALEDVKFGGIDVPKGVNIWILLVALHYDPNIWGPDANTFNPERFANGVGGSCKLPHVYVPFGAGPRICLGQNFSMNELKILLAQILSNFSFSLSPKYNHSPNLKVVMEPKDGVNLIIRKLSD